MGTIRFKEVKTEDLVRMYAVEGHTLEQIADRVGMHRNSIAYRLRMANCPIRAKNIRIDVATSELARLYFDNGKSGTEIGAQVGMTSRHVFKRLREAGYTLRKAGRGRWSDPRFMATLRPTLLDIAWAAGIYEGEGSCVLRHKDGISRGAQISVAQKQRWILDRLKALFGGTVRVSSRDRNVWEQPVTYYVWSLTGMRGRGFVMTIYKFLSPHRQERIRQALCV